MTIRQNYINVVTFCCYLVSCVYVTDNISTGII
jgi:hypothetical protein